MNQPVVIKSNKTSKTEIKELQGLIIQSSLTDVQMRCTVKLYHSNKWILCIPLNVSQSVVFETQKSNMCHTINLTFIAIKQISCHYQVLYKWDRRNKCCCSTSSFSLSVNPNDHSRHFHMTIFLHSWINVQDSWSKIFVALWMSLFALRKALSTCARSNPISINVCTCSSDGCTLFSRKDIRNAIS